jgi:hypothetical protein
MLHHQAAEQLPTSNCQDAQCTSVPDLLTGLYLLFIYSSSGRLFEMYVYLILIREKRLLVLLFNQQNDNKFDLI